MDNYTLSTKSALIAERQRRIDKNNIAILHHANKLLLSKKRRGSQAIEIMVPSKRMTHNN